VTHDTRIARLARLLNPRSVAVVGGDAAAEVIRQCRKIGFKGELWAVNSRRAEIEGLASYPDVAALPGVPDAAFVAVPREQTVDVVRALASRGTAGAVCYASGFAELGGEGVALQARLVEAAGSMALLGPNCYGAINYLDGCALWPDHFGGGRVKRGVAIITQSGNVALNLTMQGHHLPIAYMIALGNKAVTDIHDCIQVLLADARVTAIGLYLEGLTDVAAFSEVAIEALAKGIPLVVLKAGSSHIGSELAASHTRSLVGSAVLYAALFSRVGVAQVSDLGEFLETLKLVHSCPALPGVRVGSLSCSGGDALLVADLGQHYGLQFPELPPPIVTALEATLGPLVPIHNPLDYQTYIWENEPALTSCFAAMMRADIDLCLIVLDFPQSDAPTLPGWDEVVNAFIAAHATSRVPAVMVASMAELMPGAVAERLLAAGIAPMQGLRETVVAILAAAAIGAARRERAALLPLPPPLALEEGPELLLDEVAAKGELADFGIAIPHGQRAQGADEASRAAAAIGYPVVVKALSEGLAHKTEIGAVRLNLVSPLKVREAVAALAPHFEHFLVEKMVTDGLAELIVGVTRDAQFGLSLTIGAGGILVELLSDSVTLLLPCTAGEIERALRGLRCFALLDGYRGAPKADIGRVVASIAAIANYAEANVHRLVELDVNPLIVSAEGATAVDALIRVVGRQVGRDMGR